jgi:hypothetical protein
MFSSQQGELFSDHSAVQPQHGKYYVQPRGYAFPPGTGPRGETCRTCQHKLSVDVGSRTVPKCELVRVNWTHSRRTDILVRSPACQYWKPR